MEDKERKEVKGDTGIGRRGGRMDRKCIEHSSSPAVQPIQVTDSLVERMNERSIGDGRGEIQRR